MTITLVMQTRYGNNSRSHNFIEISVFCIFGLFVAILHSLLAREREGGGEKSRGSLPWLASSFLRRSNWSADHIWQARSSLRIRYLPNPLRESSSRGPICLQDRGYIQTRISRAIEEYQFSRRIILHIYIASSFAECRDAKI